MGKIIIIEGIAPAAPIGTGKHTMYVDSADEKLKIKNEADEIDIVATEVVVDEKINNSSIEVSDTIKKFGGDGSDGVVDGTTNITLTGSNNTLIVKNYESRTAGTAARIFDTGNLGGCNYIIKVKGDCDLTNWTIDGRGGIGIVGNPTPTGPTKNGGGVSFFQFYTPTGGTYNPASSGASGAGGASCYNVGVNVSGGGAGIKPTTYEPLSHLVPKKSYSMGTNGANGGGTGPYNTYYASGGGGGMMIIFEVGGNLTLNNGNTVITVAGGNGVFAGAAAGNANSGGGGGGIFVALYNGTLTGTCTPNIAGGTGGNGGGVAGGNGGDGAYLIAKNTVFA